MMFKGSLTLYSALSKRTHRVKVQLLKDFPKFQLYKGEVALVKPSLMRNFLHNGNGARYILQDSDVNKELLNLTKKQPAKKADAKNVKSKKSKLVTINKAPVPTKEQSKTSKNEKTGLSPNLTIENVKIPGLEL